MTTETIALLSDVHANLHALQAVLQHARSLGVERIWNLGDSVGYGAFPDESVKLLAEHAEINLAGNYDQKVLRMPQKTDAWRRKKHPLKWFAFQWAYQELSDKARLILHSWPQTKSITLCGTRILLVHGSPRSNKEGLDENTPNQRLEQLAETSDVDLICAGHTHRFFQRRVSHVLFLNPGSVGRPDDGIPQASYAILKLSPGTQVVNPYRVPYDRDAAIHGMRKKSLPDAFQTMIMTGRNLDFVLNETQT